MPAEPKLRQVADSSTLSTLESFEGHGPSVAPMSVAPRLLHPQLEGVWREGRGHRSSGA